MSEALNTSIAESRNTRDFYPQYCQEFQLFQHYFFDRIAPQNLSLFQEHFVL